MVTVNSLKLVLDSGAEFSGTGFGAIHSMPEGGEVVFTTSMTGYTEALTDPSYARQILVFTNPLIGNYGFEPRRMESGKVQAAAVVVSELSSTFSNPQTRQSLDAALRRAGVPILSGVDTRRLTEILRDEGAQNGVLVSAGTTLARARLALAAVPDMSGLDLSGEVTVDHPKWHHAGTKSGLRIGLVDYGVKKSIIQELLKRGAAVWQVPAGMSAETLRAAELDGILLSNGPGDPAAMPDAVAEVRKLLGRIPIFGICLGHQLLGLAGGFRTYKLKFGHRGANHPVLDCTSARVAITCQNHGFAVRMPAGPLRSGRITHQSLYDGAVEGLEFPGKRAFGIQYHPESSPGPRDSLGLFDRFFAMCRRT